MWRITYQTEVIADHIPQLPKTMRYRIKNAVETRLTEAPDRLGKPLRGSLAGLRRVRVGDYRILYRIEADQVVLITAILHRSVVYED